MIRSLVYNFTRSAQTMDFHIQHQQKAIRSVRFQHRYDEQTGLPLHFDFSTSIDRFDLDFVWQNDSRMSCQLTKNYQETINASGTYRNEPTHRIAVNLTEVSPQHLGQFSIDYTKTLHSNGCRTVAKTFDEFNRLAANPIGNSD